ncbi:protein CASC3-like [Anomaloglossus baeobatrachus]|uniref:protein CASC3-like n=1 Tax=Anomaloglossus baeobatrachus TaxID=238106 RepID=UPI003F4F6DCE
MLSKWLIARTRNPQPAAPRKHVVPHHEIKQECEDDGYTGYPDNEVVKFFIKSEYNVVDVPSTEEEDPKTLHGADISDPPGTGDGQLKETPMQVKKKKTLKKNKTKNNNNSQKQVADDEDWNDPTYIPRNGSFFNHDLRCTNDGVPRSKKQRRGVNESWKHDRYREEDQAPKSVEELIATYGFNIRAGKNPHVKCPRSPTVILRV